MQELDRPKDYFDLSEIVRVQDASTLPHAAEVAITYRISQQPTEQKPLIPVAAANKPPESPKEELETAFSDNPVNDDEPEESMPSDVARNNDGIDIPPPEPPTPGGSGLEGDDEDDDTYYKQALGILGSQLSDKLADTDGGRQEKVDRVATALRDLHQAQQAIQTKMAGEAKSADVQGPLESTPGNLVPVDHSQRRPPILPPETSSGLPAIKADKGQALSPGEFSQPVEPPTAPTFSKDFVPGARNPEIHVRPSASAVSFPSFIEIRDGNELLVQAHAIRRSTEIPSKIIDEAGAAVGIGPAVNIEQNRMQTRPDLPPGVLRIDALTQQQDAIPNAIEAALKVYAAAYMQLLMEPAPDTPGHVRFKPAVIRSSSGYTTESFPATVAVDHILGEPDIGITRILLDTYEVNLAAMRNKTKIPEVKGVQRALERQGCEVTEIEIVGLSSPYATDGIVVHFKRRKRTIDAGHIFESIRLRRTD